MAIIASLAWPAYGQQKTPQPAPGPPPKTQKEIEADKAADRAYQKSLRNIPDQPPADPWGGAAARTQPSRSQQRKRLQIRAALKIHPHLGRLRAYALD
jgi:hypothetical protein